MKKFILHYITNLVSIILAAWIMTTVSISTFGVSLLLALVITILNKTLLPLMLVFGTTFIILTMGFGIFVIDGLVFLLAAKIVTGFFIKSFWAAVWLSVITTLINSQWKKTE